MGEQLGIRATFMRGGTSKGLFFRWEDLPADTAERDGFLFVAMGSPDGFGRQFDGMGGGISSLSKAMMVRRSDRAGVDIDYLFAQVAIGAAEVDYAANCGNLSAAVGCFAVDQGLVQLPDVPGVVRMWNENTSKRIDCHLEVRAGRAAVQGAEVIAGVTGSGAPIRLAFQEPGGAWSGKLLPTGARVDLAEVDGRQIEYSFVDAANPCVFVRGQDLGCTADALPSQIDARPELLIALGAIRRQAAAAAGLEATAGAPKIALTSPPMDFTTLAGDRIAAEESDILIRMVSVGQPHLAIPLTGALCTAVAAGIAGTLVNEAVRMIEPGAAIRIGTPSGVVPAGAEMAPGPLARSASVYRTARTLMEGTVYAPTDRTGGAA
ncbi:MAG: PrpF domain-containing protein [Pseudomonadota bacterium]